WQGIPPSEAVHSDDALYSPLDPGTAQPKAHLIPDGPWGSSVNRNAVTSVACPTLFGFQRSHLNHFALWGRADFYPDLLVRSNLEVDASCSRTTPVNGA